MQQQNNEEDEQEEAKARKKTCRGVIACVLLLLLLLLPLPLLAAAAVAAAAAMRLLMWESDLNVKFDMWSVFVSGLVCFPLCSSVRINERLCLAFGLSYRCVVFLDCVNLLAPFPCCTTCASFVARALYWSVLFGLHFLWQAIDCSGRMLQSWSISIVSPLVHTKSEVRTVNGWTFMKIDLALHSSCLALQCLLSVFFGEPGSEFLLKTFCFWLKLLETFCSWYVIIDCLTVLDLSRVLLLFVRIGQSLPSYDTSQESRV